jgi:hypothetical protein
MPFVDEILGAKRPAAVHSVNLPRRERFLPSPADWRDEVLYFLLPDRFSDELSRPLLDRNDLNDAAQNSDPRGLAMGQLGEIWQRTVAGWHAARHQIPTGLFEDIGSDNAADLHLL